jgi:quercetin dioxygenase-like cupin family protein
VGSEKASGHYLMRVRLESGARIPPHTHPDHRVATVLAGTAYVGFGAVFDEKVLVTIPAGGVYEVPAGVPHFAWAKEGDVEYQESGVGPTGTEITKP